MTDSQPHAPRRRGLTRRSALSGAALIGLGAGVDRALGTALSGASSGPAPATDAVAFHGAHQAGIATPQQEYLHFAAFDVTVDSRSRLRDLLERWTTAARALTAGRLSQPAPSASHGAAPDPGEAIGLAPSRLTLTFGFGPSLFAAGRFGLSGARPAALRVLPPFRGEQLDPARSYGDLCVQACADDPQVAFHAVHVLFQVAGSDAIIRWTQLGFRRAAPGETARNLIGFKDGTNNVRPDDTGALERFVWVGAGEGPRWLGGGSYLVARRIAVVFEAWDAASVAEQERTIGRRKLGGAPLGARDEHDPVDLAARGAGGAPVIPPYAHIRLASPQLNGGQRILRRGYAYSDGLTPGPARRGGHQLDAGLFFIAFARDPARQFVPLQRRLAASDALSEFTLHTASAIFACPPGVGPGGYVGETLLA